MIKRTRRTLLVPRRKFITGAAALIGYAALPAEARLGVNQLSGFGAGAAAKGPVAITFLQSNTNGTNATSHTFSGENLGTAAADRKIVVTVSRQSTAQITSLTIGGVTAEEVIKTTYNDDFSGIWQADVPTGTSGDVVISWSATSYQAGIGLFSVTGAGTGPSAASDTGTDVTNNGDLVPVITVPANGGCIGAARQGNSATFTWTNLDEAFDEAVEGGQRHTGASKIFATEQSEITVTCSPSTSTTEQAAVLAAWGPG